MKKLQQNLMAIVIMGIVVATFLSGAITLFSFTSMEKDRNYDVLKKELEMRSTYLNGMCSNVKDTVESLSDYYLEQYPGSEKLGTDEGRKYIDDAKTLAMATAKENDNICAIYYRFNPDLIGPKGGFFLSCKPNDSSVVDCEPTDISKYDPKDAEHVAWYYDPVKAGEAIWVDQYMNKNNGILTISYVKPLYNENQRLIGVVGIDIDMESVYNEIADVKVYDRGFAALMTNKGEVRYSAEPVDITKEEAKNILSKDNNFISYIHNQKRMNVLSRKLEYGETLLLVISSEELYINEYRIVFTIILITLLASILVITLLTRLLHVLFHRFRTDSLTHTGNRSLYMDETSEIDDRIHSNEVNSFSVIIFDINGLKKVNDVLGHSAGDELIKSAAAVIREYFPKYPLYHVGGDEFVVLSRGYTKFACEHAYNKFKKEMDKRTKEYDFNKDTVVLASGMAVFDKEKDLCFDDVFRRADHNMYTNKSNFYKVNPQSNGRRANRYTDTMPTQGEGNLETLKNFDPLTQCYNRTAFEKAVKEYLRDENAQGALFIIDMDCFKKFNDTIEGEIGDKLLVNNASAIKSLFRAGDLVARLGDDEFAVFMIGMNEKSVVENKAKLLARRTHGTIVSESDEIIESTLSTGVALLPQDGKSYEELFSKADMALNYAKQKTDKRYALIKDLDEKADTNSLSHVKPIKNVTLLKGAKLSDIDEHLEKVTSELLTQNGGVGIISGRFDDDLSINYMCELSLAHLGYRSFDEFIDQTKGKLTSLMASEKDREICKLRFKNDAVVPWNIMLYGRGGKNVPVQLYNKVIENEYGKKEWCTSVHHLSEKFNDSLTEGLSRDGFIFYVNQMRDNDKIELTDYALLYLNIDNFKAINELYGIKGGDELLRLTYLECVSSFLKPILVSRTESDHFVLLADKKNLDLDRINEILTINWNVNGKAVIVRLRCGIYNIDSSGTSVAGMIDRARLAKISISDENNKPYAIYDNLMRNEYMERAQVVSDYEQALDNEEFKVFYQPVVSVKTGKIASAEALIRWNNPEKGLISPALFLPTLEKTGYISKVDQYVISKVHKFLLDRHVLNNKNVPISINLSWIDFKDFEVLDTIRQEIQQRTLPKDMIRFELTETTYSSLEKEGQDILVNLKNNDIKILLDDFGSGYSSFGMIQNYDFDILKLDMSFIRQIVYNKKSRTIIIAIISMCHNLGIEVVAEGVESEEEVIFLRENNCDYIQGYYFSKPLSEEEFIKYLDDER